MNNQPGNHNDPRNRQPNRPPQNQPRPNPQNQRGQSNQSRNPQQRPQSQPRQNPQNPNQRGYSLTGYNQRLGSQLPQVKHKSRKAARRGAILVVLTVIILAMLLVSVMIFAVRCMSGSAGSEDTTDSTSAETTPDTPPETTDPPDTTAPPPDTTELSSTYEYKTFDNDDLHSGYQILVNYQNAFVFDSSDIELKTFYGNRNQSYKISNITISCDGFVIERINEMMTAFEKDNGENDLLINSAHRTFDDQESIYAYQVDRYSEEYAAMFVAVPGYSEHHTGYAVDLTVYTDDKQSMTLDDCPEYSKWLNENAHRFGFILRYPEDKVDVTKIGYENWHYRYIGKPHAYYMYKNNLCLEEYMETLRSFTYDKVHLKITDDEGQDWEIYFVKATGETTDVPVPKYEEYTVSGNNVDGFIVTVKM